MMVLNFVVVVVVQLLVVVVVQCLVVVVFVVIVGVIALVVDFRKVMMTSPPELAHCALNAILLVLP